MQLYERCIREAVPEAVITGRISDDLSFSIDSRTINPNELFIALQGERSDGHQFIQDAFNRGAVGVMLAHEKHESSLAQFDDALLQTKIIIAVPDPLQALLRIAAQWRAQFSYPVICVTGSVGKTSAKETIARMLMRAQRSYIASRGNQNTQIGLALNLLRMRATHEVAVFELGINRRGEMAQLARMAQPTIGIITIVGHCHMEGLGSLHDIAAEKRDIFKYFTERNIGIVNGDHPLLAGISYPHPVIKVGYKTTNQIQARKVRFVDTNTECTLKIYKDRYDVVLENPHIGTVHRALVSAAVGHILAIPHADIIAAIQEPIGVAGRFERRNLSAGNGVLINDCYNANPESMKAALAAFHEIETTACKVAVLGDMLELGVNSPFWHRQIGRFLRKVPSIKKLLLVGNMVRSIEPMIPAGIEIRLVSTWQEALHTMPELIGDHEVMLLVKGSQGVGLSHLVDRCTK